MKTKLILGSLLAVGTMSYAQGPDWAGAANTTGAIYRSGSVGIGSNPMTPANLLHVETGTNGDGIRITRTNTGMTKGSCALYLENATSGGMNWSMYSLGQDDGWGGPGALTFASDPSTPRFTILGSNGNVGVGVTTPLSRLHSVTTTEPVGIRGDAYYNSGSTSGVVGNALNLGGTNTGVLAGVSGNASGGASNRGGSFLGLGGPAGVTSYGVYAEVSTPTGGGTNYGIFATVNGNANSGNGPNWAGWFNGDVETTSAAYYTSDKRLKKNISPIANSLNIISKLNPVNYTFDTESNPEINLPSVKQYGFISQEIQEIMPELTKLAIHPAKLDETGKEIYPSKEILSLNYNGFIAILAKGIQEQQTIIENQGKKINALQEQVNTLSNSKVENATGIKPGSATEGFMLDQNIPNPFSRETIINYTLPQTVDNAFMAVYDLTGKQIATLPITEKGSSSLTISSEKLSAGIYIYSIVADGKLIDSKRMIVAQQ